MRTGGFVCILLEAETGRRKPPFFPREVMVAFKRRVALQDELGVELPPPPTRNPFLARKGPWRNRALRRGHGSDFRARKPTQGAGQGGDHAEWPPFWVSLKWFDLIGPER